MQSPPVSSSQSGYQKRRSSSRVRQINTLKTTEPRIHRQAILQLKYITIIHWQREITSPLINAVVHL